MNSSKLFWEGIEQEQSQSSHVRTAYIYLSPSSTVKQSLHPMLMRPGGPSKSDLHNGLRVRKTGKNVLRLADSERVTFADASCALSKALGAWGLVAACGGGGGRNDGWW